MNQTETTQPERKSYLQGFVMLWGGYRAERVLKPDSLNVAMHILYSLNAEFLPAEEKNGEAVVHGKVIAHGVNRSRLVYNHDRLHQDLEELFGPWLGEDGVKIKVHPGTYLTRWHTEFWIHLVPEPDKHGGSLENLLTYSFKPAELP